MYYAGGPLSIFITSFQRFDFCFSNKFIEALPSPFYTRITKRKCKNEFRFLSRLVDASTRTRTYGFCRGASAACCTERLRSTRYMMRYVHPSVFLSVVWYQK